MTKGLVTKKRIGVLMGGLSAERDISMRSGLAIYQNLLEMGYDTVLIDVGKDIANVIKKEKVKLAFLALHGGIGENGSIQGLLETLGLPYTGSGVLASALAMDKEASKKIFAYHGLPIAPFMVVRKMKGTPAVTGFLLSMRSTPKPSSSGIMISHSIKRNLLSSRFCRASEA